MPNCVIVCQDTTLKYIVVKSQICIVLTIFLISLNLIINHVLMPKWVIVVQTLVSCPYSNLGIFYEFNAKSLIPCEVIYFFV